MSNEGSNPSNGIQYEIEDESQEKIGTSSSPTLKLMQTATLTNEPFGISVRGYCDEPIADEA